MYSDTDVYPKYVVYDDRVLKIAHKGADPEISQVLEFEILTNDHVHMNNAMKLRKMYN